MVVCVCVCLCVCVCVCVCVWCADPLCSPEAVPVIQVAEEEAAGGGGGEGVWAAAGQQAAQLCPQGSVVPSATGSCPLIITSYVSLCHWLLPPYNYLLCFRRWPTARGLSGTYWGRDTYPLLSSDRIQLQTDSILQFNIQLQTDSIVQLYH